MKVCPNCQTKYPDDANFCPQETCATPQGPRRLDPIAEGPPASRYELETEIGGARSGVVSRARDGQTGASVAHKLVARASLPTPAAVERAQRELKQLQRAQNPHLARVLDFGKDADGRLYVVSELCEGEPLDRFVAATGALSLDRTKAIVAQIGEALLEGQKVGVVHHDLAAKNVLIGANDRVKVINFVAPVAVSDTVFGVPEYLSPEQAEGKLVDQRSNTYSLGAIMTLMLTGQPPVSGADPAAVLQQVQKGELTPPSRSAAGSGAGLTPEIDRVVLKAMDKSPNRRPLTMRQFLTDVSALVGLGMQTAGDRGVGFAKTMMFTGGSPEVQKLVNQALAARAEASANGAASTAPAAAAGTPPIAVVAREQATPPPQRAPATPPPQVTPPPAVGGLGPRRSHGAAIAATMVALPAASPRIPGAGPAPSGHGDLDRAISATPPPASMATPPPASMATPPLAEGATPPPAVGGAQPAPTPKQAAGGTFRETLWFKKGDVDQMVAEARARVEAARGKGPGGEPEVPAEDARPLEDRYVDDGTVTTEDRKKFSLRSGGTATALPTVGSVPGERMSEAEIVGEIGGRKRMAIIGGIVAVALALVAVIALGFRGKNVAKSATAMAPVAAPAPADPPAPPPPPAPAPAAAAPKPAPAPAAVADDEGAAAPKPRAAASHKHAAAKKAKGGKKHH